MTNQVKYLLAILFVLSYGAASAQIFPLQVNPQLMAPYSPYLSDITAPGSQRLMVQVHANDITLSHYMYKLRITIEGVGITIKTKQDFIPRPLILDNGGIPQLWYGEDLSEYFDPQALDFSGISRTEYQRTARLPEGVYRFAIEVLDYHRGTVVSNKGTAVAWMILNDPPLLNVPQNNSMLKLQDPANILFTWTPRHTGSPNAAFTTEYIFQLIEIWPENRNPYDAFLTQLPLYETTLTQHQLLYGVSEPALIPGRKYAWQVEARDTEGKDLFKNKGRSEVFVFQYGEALAVPQNLQLRWAKPTTLAIRWDAVADDEEEVKYRLQYRPRKRSDPHPWYETRTKFTEKTLYHLQENTEYEVKVRTEKIAQQSAYTDILIFKTLRPEAFVCKDNVIPPPPPDDTLPVFPLGINDTIHAGGYDVLVRNLVESEGKYSGSGVAIVPWFNGAKVSVIFENIRVNDRYWLTRGSINSVWNADSESLWNYQAPVIPGSAPQAGELDITIVAADSLITITGMAIVTVAKNEDGDIVVTTSDGKTQTLAKGESYAITDEVGNGYVVDKAGNIAKTTSTEATAAAARGDRDYNIAVRFEKGQGKFGFDEKRYDALAHYYQQLEGGDYIPWKAIASSTPDSLSARLLSGDIDAGKVRFAFGATPVVPTSSANGNFTLQVQGRMAGMEEELLALYHAADSLPDDVLGKVNLVSYDPLQLKLVIVPVNHVTLPDHVRIEDVSHHLNSVYDQAIVSWNVRLENKISVALDETFDEGETGLFSNYTGDMKKVLNAYGRLRDNTYYLFLVDKPKDPSTLGYMPRNKAAGFVFVRPHAGNADQFLKTIAHELGHGAFNLKHTFSEHALPQRATDNVMDYSDGTALYKYQWDYIHEPQAVMGLFEGDEEGAMSNEYANFETDFIGEVGVQYKSSNCWKEAVDRGFEVANKFEFEVAAYAGFLRLMLCETRIENCDQNNDIGAFSCGLLNGLLQEIDWITMLESVEGASIDPEEILNCILNSFPIGGVTDDNLKLDAVVFKCLTGIGIEDLTFAIKDFITANWDTPFYQGQATAFTVTLLSPFKGKILAKLESLPQYAGKIANFKALGKARSGEELGKISTSLAKNANRTLRLKPHWLPNRAITGDIHNPKGVIGTYNKTLPDGTVIDDIKRALEELNYPKTFASNFETSSKDGFRMLNTNKWYSYIEEPDYWNNFNKPWLDYLVSQKADVVVLSDKMNDYLKYDWKRKNPNGAPQFNLIPGTGQRIKTNFGKEIDYMENLVQQGKYKWDEIEGAYKFIID